MICSITLLALTFPSYFNSEQQTNTILIIKKAKELGEDPYYLVATAWVESRIKASKISHTGDYGIFQINWRFWAKK